MITEDYVSFEVAELLKEKGFNEYCFAAYSPEIGDFITVGPIKNSEIDADKDDTHICTAPTHQMAMKWMREACAIEISIACFELDSYRYDVYEIDSSYFRRQIIDFYSDEFCSYEDAVEAALKYCLTELI